MNKTVPRLGTKIIIMDDETYGIKYSKVECEGPTLIGYCDSDFAGDESTNKSTTGYTIMFNGSIFHWKTQLQRHVTLSSTEAEVIALCALTKELMWIRRMLLELHLMKPEPATIFCDNKSSMLIVRSEKAAGRTRHLKARYSFIREMIECNELRLEHVQSAKHMVAESKNYDQQQRAAR